MKFIYRLLGCLLGSAIVPSLASANSLIAYVSNSGGGTVSMISLDDLTVRDLIPVGDSPGALVLTPDGSRLYVANSASDNISVIDTLSHSVIGTILVGDSPSALTVSRDGRRVYVANFGSSSLSVISTVSNAVEMTVPTPPTPLAVSYHPVRDEIWVGFDTHGTVMSVLSAADHSVLASITSNSRLYASGGLQFTPDGNEVFGTELCGCCGRFHRLSGAHSNGKVPVLQTDMFSGGNWAVGVAVHPFNGTAYFAQQGHCSTPPAPRISELGGANRVLALNQLPQALAITPDGSRLCIVFTNALQIVEAATLSTITNLPVGALAKGLVLGDVNLTPALSIRISQFELCWQSASNNWYQVQYSTVANTNQWTPLSTTWSMGNGATQCTTDSVLLNTPRRFYRLAITNSPP